MREKLGLILVQPHCKISFGDWKHLFLHWETSLSKEKTVNEYMLYMYTMSKYNNEYMLRSYECTQPTGR